MQNIKETSDTLRGPKVNARKHSAQTPRFLTNTIAVINPFKTLQKPLEAILKPSKGFSLSATHPKSENAVKGQYADRLRSGNP